MPVALDAGAKIKVVVRMFEVTNHVLLAVLFLSGLVAGTVDAVAGGGGLISLPMLLAVGVPPHLALGTNKLQASVGTLIATRTYYREGLISLKVISKGLIFGFVGAVLGAVLSQFLNGDILKNIIPVLLLVIFFYTLCSPKLGVDDKSPLFNEVWFYILFGFSLGFYDGFFGPGTGSLWVFVLTFFLGYNLIKAAAYTKVFNLKSNIIATVCFAFGHNIDYHLGLYMAAGQLLGGRLGAYLAIKKGAKLIRPFFLLMVASTILVLSYRSYIKPEMVRTLLSQINFIPVLIASIAMLFFAVILYKQKTRKGPECI